MTNPADPPPDATGGTRQEEPDTLPPLVSIMARHTRMVELLLAICVLGLVLVLGLFTVVAVYLARAHGGIESSLTWVPSAALLGGMLLGVLGTRHGLRTGRPMMPWALAGGTLWLLPSVWLLARISG